MVKRLRRWVKKRYVKFLRALRLQRWPVYDPGEEEKTAIEKLRKRLEKLW